MQQVKCSPLTSCSHACVGPQTEKVFKLVFLKRLHRDESSHIICLLVPCGQNGERQQSAHVVGHADVVTDAWGGSLHLPPAHCVRGAAALRIVKNPPNPVLKSPLAFYSCPHCCDLRPDAHRDSHITCPLRSKSNWVHLLQFDALALYCAGATVAVPPCRNTQSCIQISSAKVFASKYT